MRLPGKVVIVLDILFATTTMVAALAHGASRGGSGARRGGRARALRGLPPIPTCSPASSIRRTLEGFAHPAPLALIEHGVREVRRLFDHQRHRGDDARRRCDARLLRSAAQCAHLVATSARSTPARPCSSSARAPATTSTSRTSTARATSSSVRGAPGRAGRPVGCGEGGSLRVPPGAHPRGAARLPRGPHDGVARPCARSRVRLPPGRLSGRAGARRRAARLVA